MDTYWVEREYLRGRERAENFPVALRILPRQLRRDLSAVYAVARVIDDLGDEADQADEADEAGEADEAPTDRTARLTAFQKDLASIWTGAAPNAAVLRQLVPTVARCALSEQPFQDLVRANLYDQTHATYRSYADLLAYCELSANPVGRIVLEIFGAADPTNLAYSDQICTALQIIEHCQDVAEDAQAGRCYLPQEDLDRFGVAVADWSVRPTAPALRQVVTFELDRCAALLNAGLPLVGRLHGWARLAVAGYAAGGRAALLAIRRQKCDVMSVSPAPRRLDSVRQMIATLSGRRVAT